LVVQTLQREGVQKVAFCGVDEVTEIAYLSLRETAIELAVVMDDERGGAQFFDKPVVPIAMGLLSGNHRIVITSLKKGEALREKLVQLGVDPQTIYVAVGAVRSKSERNASSARLERLMARPVWI